MDSTEGAVQLPLISLQPIADAQHAWVAMLLRAETPLDDDMLARLFGDLGLGNALNGLPCAVASVNPDDWEADLSHLDPFLRRVPAIAAANAEAPATPALLARWPGSMLALGVNNFQDFERCQHAGFIWFEGTYALHRIPGAAPQNAMHHALVLQLLTLITHDAETHEIENMLKRDAHLSYQLLRLVNSVAFALNHRITSFNHAITVLGRQQLQRWLQLLLYARPAGAGRSPLLPRAAMRAACMEAIFQNERPDKRDRAFMSGMFSLLDVMLHEPLAKIIAPLHLMDDVSQALLDRSGPFGPALRAVEAGERSDGEALAAALAEAGIDHGTWTSALVKACGWAVPVSREA
jgi:EAL and modified HD-GYP domain-containing signal transduction protein